MRSDGREPHRERLSSQDCAGRRTVDWNQVRSALLPPSEDEAGEALAMMVMSISKYDDGATISDPRSE